MPVLFRFGLCLVFSVAGATKLLNPSAFRKSLAGFGVSGASLTPLSVIIPFFELLCAAALLSAAGAWWGAVGALTLLAIFSVAVGVVLATGRKAECHCFGQLSAAPVTWRTLLRNLILAALPVYLVVQGRRNLGAGAWTLLSGLQGTQLGMLALTALFATLAAFCLWLYSNLMRQQGRILSRLDALEGNAPANVAAPPPAGLPAGSQAPPFILNTIDGGRMSLSDLMGRQRAILLFFTDVACGVCSTMLRDVARWQRIYSDRMAIVPVTRGEEEACRAKYRPHGIRDVLLQGASGLHAEYLVDAFPSAVLIREGAIASPLATGPDAIRDLIKHATLPAPVKRGAAVPSLKLPDRGGNIFDLADLRGHPTLLLFWNPACSFCQRMEPDALRLDNPPSEDAPGLVVISTGALDTANHMKFQSRVLIDPEFTTGPVFSVAGTPSAILLDEDGRIASGVATGAGAILTLAGSARPAGLVNL